MINKIKNFERKVVVKGQIFMINQMYKIKNKLNSNDGVSLSKEHLGWVIAILVVIGISISFVKKFFPDLFDMVGNKVKEMFNEITIG